MLKRAWETAKHVQIWILVGVAVAVAIWIIVVVVRSRARKRAAARASTLSAVPGGRAQPPAQPTRLKRTTEA